MPESIDTHNRTRTSPTRQFLILIILAASIFLIEREFSVWLGKRAVTNSGMPSLEIEEAFKLAKNDGNPLLVNFSAYWCGYCRSFENGALANPEVQEFVQKQFHYVRLEHTDKSMRHWFDRYEVIGFPTLLIIAPGGYSLDQVQAIDNPEKFLAQFTLRQLSVVDQ